MNRRKDDDNFVDPVTRAPQNMRQTWPFTEGFKHLKLAGDTPAAQVSMAKPFLLNLGWVLLYETSSAHLPTFTQRLCQFGRGPLSKSESQLGPLFSQPKSESTQIELDTQVPSEALHHIVLHLSFSPGCPPNST